MMGAVITSVDDYLDSLSEIVGYKSGIALTRDELIGYLAEQPGLEGIREFDGKDVLRIRSEVIQDTVVRILNKLGNTDAKGFMPLGVDLLKKYQNDPKKLELLFKVGSMVSHMTVDAIPAAKKPKDKTIDPAPIVKAVEEKYGALGALMACETMRNQAEHMHLSFWSRSRLVEWTDTIELKGLFESESLQTSYGHFFDQRYIDYLFANFDHIDDINWRKFEGLTAEFFSREGFHCVVGPGRNDGGVDIRVWPRKEDETMPPMILIQCKRQRDKVSGVVVKALWADVQHERAESGLIVTTSTLAPGAETLRKVRSYEIGSADRKALRQWIQVMRGKTM